MEVCLTGHEKSPFFIFLFFQHLPNELCIMRGEDDVDDLLAISLNADKLWSIHNHQQYGTLAFLRSTSETLAATVAVVKQSFPAKQRGGGHGRGVGKGAPHRGAGYSSSLNPSAAVYSPPPSFLARQSAGLCFYHDLLVRRPQSVTASAPCWGEKEFIFIFSGKQFKWTLILADVKFPCLAWIFLTL